MPIVMESKLVAGISTHANDCVQLNGEGGKPVSNMPYPAVGRVGSERWFDEPVHLFERLNEIVRIESGESISECSRFGSLDEVMSEDRVEKGEEDTFGMPFVQDIMDWGVLGWSCIRLAL
jgi:hypothetical protein